MKRTDNQNLVSEYRYNGLGHRITWHYDTDTDGDTDSNDKTYHFVYDDQWRIVGTYRDSDSSPKERFVYHAAGNDGYGSASYIDAAVLRDRDKNAGWTSASDGTLEERIYYCQNWRADVVAIIDNSKGGQAQMDRYGEYGEAFGMPAGDTEGDGDVDAADLFTIQNWVGLSYDVRGDVDLDGDVDSTDLTAATGNSGTTLGWGKLSLAVGATAGGNRKGYAGYENDGALTNSLFYHVKHRVYYAGLGRWITRDPIGYSAERNLHAYARHNPMARRDPLGLCAVSTCQEPPTTSPDCPCKPGPYYDACRMGCDMAEHGGNCEDDCSLMYPPETQRKEYTWCMFGCTGDPAATQPATQPTSSPATVPALPTTMPLSITDCNNICNNLYNACYTLHPCPCPPVPITIPLPNGGSLTIPGAGCPCANPGLAICLDIIKEWCRLCEALVTWPKVPNGPGLFGPRLRPMVENP